MLYGRDSISASDVKNAIKSKELKKKVSNSNEDKLDAGLVVCRGRTRKGMVEVGINLIPNRGLADFSVFTVKKEGISDKIAHNRKKDMKGMNKIVVVVQL
jgi:hypothetical protein